MKYRRLALAAAFLLAAIPFAGHAAAEQAAAETYRALFAGNHFLLEYQVAGEAQFRQIVSDGTRRFSNLGVQRKKNVSYRSRERLSSGRSCRMARGGFPTWACRGKRMFLTATMSI